MKKIFWFLLMVGLPFLVGGFFVRASTSDLTSPIFKIQAYSYNKVSDMYTLEQYGSAVLVAPNILLTNSHVITDDNDNLTLQYEACQTISDQEAPKCFSVLQLLKYDKNADLALLQIVNSGLDMPTPVTLGSGTLNVGDSIHIIGYPANGGDTITTTQGTIAGFEDDYYKTDANVDEGNSGGGSFDNEGNFIGIPTYVVNGQTTLGYIIPISTIKDFINGSFGTTYRTKYSSSFDKWLKSMYALQSLGVVTNPLFTTPSFTGINLEISNLIEKKTNNLYSYGWINANGSTLAMMSLIATDNTAITRYINNEMKYFTDNDYSPKKSTKKIGSTSFTTIFFSDDTTVGYDYIQTSSTNKTYLEFVIIVDRSNISDLSGFVQFLDTTAIKKNYTKPQVFTVPFIKLSSKWNIGIVKRLQDDGLHIGLFPANSNYSAEVSFHAASKGNTLKKLTAQMMSLYTAVGVTAVTEVSKYPSSASIITVTDENEKKHLTVVGVKKYLGSDFFVTISIDLHQNDSAKSAAINMAYKVLGLE